MKQYTTFRYWRFTSDPKYKNAIICAAIEVDLENSQGSVGYSFCAPNQKSFKKDRGRQIAHGRLLKKKTRPGASIKVQFDPNKKISKQINERIFGDILHAYWVQNHESTRVPRWVVKASGCNHSTED